MIVCLHLALESPLTILHYLTTLVLTGERAVLVTFPTAVGYFPAVHTLQPPSAVVEDTGGRLQPVLMRHPPSYLSTLEGGAREAVWGGGVGWRVCGGGGGFSHGGVHKVGGQSMGVRIPNSRGHAKAWEPVSPTQGATPKHGKERKRDERTHIVTTGDRP